MYIYIYLYINNNQFLNTYMFGPQLQDSMKDLYFYLESFRHHDGDPLDEAGAHPASLVLELLAENDSSLRCGQLDAWFQEYVAHRGMPYLYKKLDFCETCRK